MAEDQEEQSSTTEAGVQVNYIQLTSSTTKGPGNEEEYEYEDETDPTTVRTTTTTRETTTEKEKDTKDNPLTPIPKGEKIEKVWRVKLLDFPFHHLLPPNFLQVKAASQEKASNEAVNDYEYDEKKKGGILKSTGLSTNKLPVISQGEEEEGDKKGKGKGKKSSLKSSSKAKKDKKGKKGKLTGSLKALKPIAPIAPISSMDSMESLPPLPALR